MLVHALPVISRYRYASRRYVQFEFIAEVGLRLGAVRASDLDGFEPEDRNIHLRHRPEGPDGYGTPLKNGIDGERIVNLSPQLVETIQDNIDHNRIGVLD